MKRTTEAVRRIDPARLCSLALTAAVVGLLAGIVAAAFATVAGEPSIDDAIAIEEARAEQADRAGQADGHLNDALDEAHVSRSDQRGIGLFSAYALTGAAFGGLLALTAHGLRRGRSDAWPRVLMAGGILAGAITLAPWLKYPPNPPAVGDPDTLGQRQSWYVTTILVAALVGFPPLGGGGLGGGATPLGAGLGGRGSPPAPGWRLRPPGPGLSSSLPWR